jgi:glycolate oxidase FAD binding subunit
MLSPSGERETMQPRSVAQAVEAVRDSGERPLLLRGAGTKLGWGAPVDAELELDTRGLDSLISHNAGDMTAEVGAGMPLARLQEELASAGQWLALDPPGPDATVGGIMAAGDAGHRRLRYGTVRDLVIGSAFVLADGTLSHSGSHVIKNVAGYDITRLLTGSLGTLGLIAQVIVRLHPLPAMSRTLRISTGLAPAAGFAQALASSPLEPSAITWSDAGGLLVRLEGGADGVTAAVPRARELAGRHGLDADVIEGDAETAAWAAMTDATIGPDDAAVARAGLLPEHLPEAVTALTRAAGERGVEAAVVVEARAGTATASVTGDPAASAAVVAAWRAEVERLGGRLTLRRLPEAAAGLVDAWGTPPSAVVLMRQVKCQLDPGDRFGPGRFAPWF